MPEGILCNKKTVDTQEHLDALLADTSGKQYYEELDQLEVNKDALWTLIQNTFKSRFKDINSQAYTKMLIEIERRLDRCKFYKND